MDEKSGGKIGRALERGARLAAVLAGATTTVVTGDPLAGAGAGWATSEALNEVIGRVTERAAVRAGAAMVIIAVDANEHEARGDTPRADGFFDDRGALRPEAHELLEAILLAAANSFEERKLPYVAHLFDSVAYDSSIRSTDGLFLARMADQLTYHQLVALSVFSHREDHELSLAAMGAEKDQGRAERATARGELDDLAARGLLTTLAYREMRSGMTGSINQYPYGQMCLTDLGEMLTRVMRLDSVPDTERHDWISSLLTDRGRRPAG